MERVILGTGELGEVFGVDRLVIDEVGYIPVPARGGEPVLPARQQPLRACLADRHQQQALRRWGEVFSDDIAAAMMEPPEDQISPAVDSRPAPSSGPASCSGHLSAAVEHP